MTEDNAFAVPPKCAIWTSRRQAVESPRVLVVDDYVDTADAIGMVLAIEDFPTRVVYGGHEAIDAARQWHPDIVMLDIWMPDVSGIEVAIRLRADPVTSNAILVAHSAVSSTEDVNAVRLAHFDAYCSKPTDPSMLGPLLRYLCRGA